MTLVRDTLPGHGLVRTEGLAKHLENRHQRNWIA